MNPSTILYFWLSLASVRHTVSRRINVVRTLLAPSSSAAAQHNTLQELSRSLWFRRIHCIILLSYLGSMSICSSFFLSSPFPLAFIRLVVPCSRRGRPEVERTEHFLLDFDIIY